MSTLKNTGWVPHLYTYIISTIYDIIMSWLEKPEIRDVTGTMSMDLASRRSMEGGE